MLLLLVSTGDLLYAIDAKSIVEIIPAIPLDEVFSTPPVSGILNYHGRRIPILELNQLLDDVTPSTSNLANRIVILTLFINRKETLFGVRAQSILNTLSIPHLENPPEISPPENYPKNSPYFSQYLQHEGKIFPLLSFASLSIPPIG